MTTNTKAFEITRIQGVIIITPLGDVVSFRDIDVQREAGEINQLLATEKCQRAIVNLSRANYFSSLMIGMINSFGHTVQKQGGQLVLCHASQQMQSILKVMRLDTLWPNFADQNAALKVVKAWR